MEPTTFRGELRERFATFVAAQDRRFPDSETLRIDLHCHDRNSDVPDELLGRLLGWPESWVPTEDVVAALAAAGTQALTITNHNNARSCWQLLEKGVDVLPGILAHIRRHVPRARLVVAGTGPAEDTLRAAAPDAIFLGWVEPARLAQVYASCDLLLLPSRFDTFGCVVLEALACGLPVIAYAAKGPKDIVRHGECGFLASDAEGLARHALLAFTDPETLDRMRQAAVARAADYQADVIVDELVGQLGLAGVPAAPATRAEPRAAQGAR